MSFIDEIHKRRTFGVIAHPDAGKTTLTEKLLLFGGAIQEAGAVKSNKNKIALMLFNTLLTGILDTITTSVIKATIMLN